MNNLKQIIIVGGGTAGWMTAACFSKTLKKLGLQITLVESPDIKTVGVGEATIPPILDFIRLLGIDEPTFIKQTQATFKLGIKFIDWLEVGQSYWHQFGSVGSSIDGVQFYQHWLKSRRHGNSANFTDYAPAIAMAKENKFAVVPESDRSILSGCKYALHFDAALVAKLLRGHAEQNGVKRIERNVKEVCLKQNGFIDAIILDSGEKLSADFFVDCSGFKGLLIEEALHTGYEDWSSYLPCDSAVVAQTTNLGASAPYTQSRALANGWQWRIPLQYRSGNGYVFCSKFCSDDEAEALFRQNIAGDLLTEPRFLRFKTGMRTKIWNKNCLAVGLSSGFLEPLESTSIHLIVKAIVKFIEMFPTAECADATVQEYNRVLNAEYEAIRDFIILHYCTTQRSDTDFWKMCGSMDIPETLNMKIELFKSQGRLYKNEFDLFSNNSWYAVLEGMGIRPSAYDPLVDLSGLTETQNIMRNGLDSLNTLVKKLPSHDEFIRQHCHAPPP